MSELKATALETTQKTAPASGTVDIQSLYVKEQICKVPHAPSIFQQPAALSDKEKPATTLEMSIHHQALAGNTFEVTLKLHITMKQQQQTVLTMEVQQAGLFKLGAFEPESQSRVLGAYCPGLLYPYARKVVSNLAVDAGLLPITLPPINFEAMYQQRQSTQSKGADSSAIREGEAVITEKMTVQ